VYKVKHEIFLGDVTAFSTALRKAVQDLSAAALSFQMGQPTVRPDTVTMAADPAMALGLNFDDLLDNWQSFMEPEEDESDDEYGRPKKKPKKPSAVENVRANLHTLDENLEQMLSGSFDASFMSGAAGGGEQSSQVDDGYGFNVFEDNPFVAADGFDLGQIGDELANELGEGWGSALTRPIATDAAMDVDEPMHPDFDDGMDFDQGGFSFAALNQPSDDATSASHARAHSVSGARKRPFDQVEEEHQADPAVVAGAAAQLTARTPTPPWASPARDGQEPLAEQGMGDEDKPGRKKAKRVRLLLDARTELTDDELKAARAQYVEDQNALRNELEQKRLTRQSGRLVEEMLWGVPLGLQAPILIDFWLQNFKIQVEARSGALHLDRKRASRSRTPVARGLAEDILEGPRDLGGYGDAWGDLPLDIEMGGQNIEEGYVYHDQDTRFDMTGQQRSSEEPGQARRGSLPPSPRGGNFDFDFGRGIDIEPLSVSQRSGVFPWDHAGPSSSSAGDGLFDPANDRVSIGHSEVRIRAGSAGKSRRESSLISSQPGGFGFSPGAFGKLGPQTTVDDFEFEVPAEGHSHAESHQSDVNLVTLERNSYNFLEYARMQVHALPEPSEGVSFDAIVPKATSTPHVASAAFYHCLVLATKNLIRVNQPEAYGALTINIISGQ
ncbi:hypothetical protein OF83DRAFT_1089355, partial [Amylostereum chailletii]